MMRRHVLIALFLAVFATAALAQSADQQIVSVSDSPDPVTPGNNVTYTVVIRNNGPDPAVNGGLNISLPLNLTYTSNSVPAGWSCFAFGGNVSCTTPSFASGAQETITIITTLAADRISFPDGTLTTLFSTSGTTPDPVLANNSASATTAYDTPQINMTVAATDSPDPITPDNDLTYTVTVANAGPDTATSGQFSMYHVNGLTFKSITVPAGWSCTPPAVGGTPAFTCTIASMAGGASSVFTIVVRADQANLGTIDQVLQTSFSISATGNETAPADNQDVESTNYVTPDADVAITASDSPDPVLPNGNITYTINVTNNGPDAATNAQMSIVGNGGFTRFQSITTPAGWTCSMPAPGTLINFGGYSCTNPSVASGVTSTFTLVVSADSDINANSDHAIVQAFTTSSAVADPNGANNTATVSTMYVVNDADMAISVTDSPDPVSPGGNITYTVTVTNSGPDAATNARMTLVGNGGQTRFVSVSAPAGWTCTMPAAGTLLNVAGYDCTIASFASGASAVFTVVTEAGADINPNADHTITQAFTTFAAESDPDNTDNQETESTLYEVPDADLSVTNSDSPDPVSTGGTITYTQTVTNSGPDAATNASFTQGVPAGTTFQSLSAPAGWSCTTPAVGGTGTITCTNASVANGSAATFTLVVEVTAASGTISDTVTISSSTHDPDGLDNSAQALTQVTGVPVADLSVSKTTTATNATVGSTYDYTITVTNNGPDAATNVVMTDTLPASLLFRSITTPAGFNCTTPAVGASGTITCTAATLANGANAAFTLVVEVATGANGSIVNQAGVTSSTQDGNSGNSTGSAPAVVAAAATADLALTKSTTATSAVNGSTITYTIAVTNNGPATADGVVVNDTLPAGLTFVSASSTIGTCNAASPIACTIGTLASGSSATITVQATVTATSGTIANTATASTTTTDGNGGNNSATTPSIPVVVSQEPAEQIPTLSEWALIALALALAGIAVAKRI